MRMNVQYLFAIFVFVLCVESVRVSASVEGAHPAPTWGGTKQWKCRVNFTDPDVPTAHHWKFNYYYDATIPADRYEHPAGQADEVCQVKSVPFGQPCTVINTPDGTAWILSGDTCCKFPIKIGPVLYDWVERSNGTWFATEMINNVTSDVWVAEGQYSNYFAQSVDERHLPVRYWEHKTAAASSLKEWDFMLDTFVAGPVDPELFKPPQTCEDTCEHI
eukprot:TRINITY_DN81618_c0_g1_i1.p1 TRINITY_DN81618_c0_g1~~TRINITY_DN81618_c0_g1_i1.p1  ORF type:complete len:218 (+),score=35.71 TRINITY_DN81618_c0_g1_i1:78-731(+)